MSLQTKGRIPYLRYDTLQAPDDEPAELWRKSHADLCDVDMELETDGPASEFTGRNESWMLENTVFRRGESSAHILNRSTRAIRRDQVDHYMLQLLKSGRGCLDLEAGNVEVRKRRVHGNAGECTLVDLAQPARQHLGAGERITVFVPRDLLAPLLERPVDLHGIVLRGACAALLASHLSVMVERLPELEINQAKGLSLATLHLLAACLTPSLDTFALARPAIESTLRRKICLFIEKELAQDGLSIEQICKQFAMSRSALFRLFEPLGGVARYIRERRLSRIHGVLTAADRRVSLERISGDYGFKTAAHFSRVFREKFGYSPRELLTGGRQEQGPQGSRSATAPSGRWLAPILAI